jgi:hypothetical protein
LADVFEELANDSNGLVYYDKLQERLIATGRLHGNCDGAVVGPTGIVRTDESGFGQRDPHRA